jgi:hypothetical protein
VERKGGREKAKRKRTEHDKNKWKECEEKRVRVMHLFREVLSASETYK